jgi:hypothetical protein
MDAGVSSHRGSGGWATTGHDEARSAARLNSKTLMATSSRAAGGKRIVYRDYNPDEQTLTVTEGKQRHLVAFEEGLMDF